MTSSFSRRDVMRFALTTAPAIAVAGKMALWPSSAIARPVAKPVVLLRDESGYLVDPAAGHVGTAPVDLEELSRLEAADICGYGTGVRLHQHLGGEHAAAVGLVLIDGEMPGSDFLGVRLDAGIEHANDELTKRGINLLVREA